MCLNNFYIRIKLREVIIFRKNNHGELESGEEAFSHNSYYPFTEPSVEMDMSYIYCDGLGCFMCKPKG